VKVVFSDAAEADLEEIGDYIAKDDPRRALTFVRELRSVALRLGDMPKVFPLVPRYEHHGIRRRPAGNFLIFYRVEGCSYHQEADQAGRVSEPHRGRFRRQSGPYIGDQIR
jgi:toxin ParE1/3/4